MDWSILTESRKSYKAVGRMRASRRQPPPDKAALCFVGSRDCGAALLTGTRSAVQHQHREQHGQIRERKKELVARPALARLRAQPLDAVPEEEQAGQERGGE